MPRLARRCRARPAGMVPGTDGWWFTSERAAVRLESRTAVIADVHLGYEWARAARGDMVVPHSLEATIERLGRLFDRCPIDRLIVAGDLVESRRGCPRTARQLDALSDWLGLRKVEWTWLAGNHDPPRHPPLPSTLEIDGWTIAHGHAAIEAERLMIGHYHPLLRGPDVEAPCFLASARLMVLPAFTDDAAGHDVTHLGLPETWRDDQARVIAGLDDALLDFGPIGRLRRRAKQS